MKDLNLGVNIYDTLELNYLKFLLEKDLLNNLFNLIKNEITLALDRDLYYNIVYIN